MLNFNEFIEKDEIQKIEILKGYWNLDDAILIGKIAPLKSPDQKFRFINNIQDLNGNYIGHPFLYSAKINAHCGQNNNEDMNNLIVSLNENDMVLFRFIISRQNKDRIKENPISADPTSICKLKNIECVDSKNRLELFKSIKESMVRNPYIERLIIKEDVEKEVWNTIEEVENNLQEYKVLINEKNTELQKIEQVILEKLKEENSLKSQISEKQSKLLEVNSALNDLGFIENACDLEMNSDIEDLKCDLDRKKHIEYIKNYLGVNYQKNLYYTDEVLEQFYGALCTNQLVVLSGAPGTGKTSLVEGFSEVVGANLKIIPVQPNWTDNQDLLGFYNPIEKAYVPTPFLDAIIEAGENEDRLYIICLDEMNLAQVEFYFSEFLSKLQSTERSIELYSEYIYKQTKHELINRISDLSDKNFKGDSPELEGYINKLNTRDRDYSYKLKWQWNFINRYPAKIKIPANVRFVGTINKDETTKNLSPKVIDRSYIMEIVSYNKDVEKNMKRYKKKYQETYCQKLLLKAENFKYIQGEIPVETKNALEELEKCLYDIKIQINSRFYDQIREYIGANIYDKSNILDNIVAAKILPKINVNLPKTAENEDKIKKIGNLINDLPLSKATFDPMREFWNTYKILSFWR